MRYSISFSFQYLLASDSRCQKMEREFRWGERVSFFPLNFYFLPCDWFRINAYISYSYFSVTQIHENMSYRGAWRIHLCHLVENRICLVIMYDTQLTDPRGDIKTIHQPYTYNLNSCSNRIHMLIWILEWAQNGLDLSRLLLGANFSKKFHVYMLNFTWYKKRDSG